MKCLPVSFFLVSASLLTGCGEQKIQIVEEKCGTCHTAEIVYNRKRANAEWDRVVYGMKVRGLKITEAEESLLKSELYNKLGSETR